MVEVGFDSADSAVLVAGFGVCITCCLLGTPCGNCPPDTTPATLSVTISGTTDCSSQGPFNFGDDDFCIGDIDYAQFVNDTHTLSQITPCRWLKLYKPDEINAVVSNNEPGDCCDSSGLVDDFLGLGVEVRRDATKVVLIVGTFSGQISVARMEALISASSCVEFTGAVDNGAACACPASPNKLTEDGTFSVTAI